MVEIGNALQFGIHQQFYNIGYTYQQCDKIV